MMASGETPSGPLPPEMEEADIAGRQAREP
jgi:hypothetical protein